MSHPDNDDVIAWVVRTSDPDFAEWDQFEAWLDGDPTRGPAYRRAMVAVDDTAAVIAASSNCPTGMSAPSAEIVPFSLDRVPASSRHSRRWLQGAGLAMAASIAGFLLIARPRDEAGVRIVEAPPGRVSQVELGDGSRIALAGGGRLTFPVDRPREVTLERGRALFDVIHDQSKPFRVRAGPARIVDVGTVFEVLRLRDAIDVAVAEGAVVIDSPEKPIPLGVGQAAILRDGHAARLMSREPKSIGQWRRDRMSYRDVPFAQVAADLSSALDRPITTDATLRDRRFTGSIVVAAVRSRPEDLAELLDVDVRVADGRMELTRR